MNTSPSLSRPETQLLDLDLGFDALINRYGTHRLLDPAALARLRPDLSGLIAPLEVTFAAYLADGTIVLCCPDGIPEDFAELVEPLGPPPQLPAPAPVAPTQGEITPALADRLDALSNKLDSIQRDQALGAQIATRLEDVRSTLLEGLARSAPRENPSPAALQMWDTDQLVGDMAGRVGQMLERTEARMMSLLRDAARPSVPQLEMIEQGVTQLVASNVDHPALKTQLDRIEGNVNGLIQRPTPLAELAVQRKGIAHFLESMNTVMRRLDGAIDRLDAPENPAADPLLAEVKEALAGLDLKLDGLGDARPDLSRLYQMLDILRDDIRQAALALQPQADALQNLSGCVDTLVSRPDPTRDLTLNRQSIGALSEMIEQGLQRLEAAGAVLAQRPDADTDALTVETRALHQDLRSVLDNLALNGDEISSLRKHISTLVNTVAPKPDLTEQRKDFARFGTALGQALRRLEERSQKQDAIVQDLQTVAAEAIVGLMLTQSITADQTEVTDPIMAARWQLAEAMATDFKRRDWSPVKQR